ncbi:MAG TPA: rod shape-determining protein MreC [Terriglobales bacterium]|nr:rod shape-determining protein MreC [Terriglobales bacterium]
MENIVGRYRNVTILVAILFAQVLGLAIQVKRSAENQSTRLIRVWTVAAITPLERGIVGLQGGIAGIWHNYFYLRGVRQENRDLKAEIERLRLEQVRLKDDAEQARRLQLLLGFKEQFISHTVAAQVIGSSGTEQSRSVYIDKGSRDGIEKEMAVITADGVVGKVLHVFNSTAQVLLISDQLSGVGTILEESRLQGVLRGTASGEVVLDKIMNDEEVQAGARVLTSGGDQIFPKGLLVGTVSKSSHGPESFLNIKVKPAANLSKLEEVLVITKNEEKQSSLASTEDAAPVRAVDVLAQRLPSVPDKPKVDPTTGKPVETGNPAKPDSSKLANASAGASTIQKPNAVTTGNSQALAATSKLPSAAGVNRLQDSSAHKIKSGQTLENETKSAGGASVSAGTASPPPAAIKPTHSVPKTVKPQTEPPVTGDTIPAQDVPQ